MDPTRLQAQAAPAIPCALSDAKDANGDALDEGTRYKIGIARGHQEWKVDSVDPDGSVNLSPLGGTVTGGGTTRKRRNVEAETLKPQGPIGENAAPVA
ncbi:hypothetical protein [Rhodococcus qingshengii]|uniref:hypothetical protein n=1 Tax=Rhodococcus qingshengii TaxID=334542 RepID=UPI0036DC3FF7